MAPKGRRYIVRGAKAAAGTMLAAATVAAMTAFAPVPTAPVSTTARVAGVHQDLARAIALRQVTPEQASKFEQRLFKRLNEDDS
ncbi:hypothetical protein FHU41_001665 [Psychromicrobium silvestre]|uniref:Uncharacterized protein n=1 Tax=Psychromicrobium silvestre TaxID=1645614 RepID=A0A7Y9LTU3_9MICC|nr:hypothetical protein [Psychromicrobium silvestre]NYE95415.1 hypothetical protein [Psychromicrobium silvestre]